MSISIGLGLFLFEAMDQSSDLTHIKVLNSLANTWQMLAGTRLAFSEYEVPFRARRDDHYYVMTLGWRGGGVSTVALQIADNNLIGLAAAMFGESHCEIDADQADDAGKELCNIFCACCIQLLPDPEHVEPGLPKKVDALDFWRLLTSGCMAYRFGAGNLDGSLAISIVRPNMIEPRSGLWL